MALSKCFEKFGDALSDRDKSAIESMVESGVAEADAVASVLDFIDQQIDSLASNIEAQGGTVNRLEQPVFQGSPTRHSGVLDAGFIGTGEGAQVYGYGHYVAENINTAKSYSPRDFDYEEKLLEAYDRYSNSEMYTHMEVYENAMQHETPTELRERYRDEDDYDEDFREAASEAIDEIEALYKDQESFLYEYDLDDSAVELMLDWDKPLSEQSEGVIAALEQQFSLASFNEDFSTAGEFYYSRVRKHQNAEDASFEFKELGIPGIKYLDQGSRQEGDGTRNYVIFPGAENIVTIKNINGEAVSDDVKMDILEQFAGEKSGLSDLGNLRRAKEMHGAKMSMETIRRETGWHRGVDAMWRYEISDDGATIKAPFKVSEGTWGDIYEEVTGSALGGISKELLGMEGTTERVNVADVMRHPVLFLAYPHLQDIEVTPREGTGATFYRHEGRIAIGEDNPVGEVRTILLHELQHAIQLEEGFASGGNSNQEFIASVKAALNTLQLGTKDQQKTWESINGWKIKGAKKASEMARDAMMYDSAQRLRKYAHSASPSGVFKHIRNNMQWIYEPEFKGDVTANNLSYKFYEIPKRHKLRKRSAFIADMAMEAAGLFESKIDPDSLQKFKDDTRSTKGMVDALVRESSKMRKKLEPLEEIKRRGKRAETVHRESQFKSPYHVYKALAGEIEARNTEARKDLTAEERRNTPIAKTADAPSEHAIVIVGGNEIQAPASMAMEKQRPRGYYDPKRKRITLTENADLSTFMHESAHYFLDVMRDLSTMDESIASDLQIIEGWWASQGLKTQRDKEEAFANGYEQFLYEGKAPVPELQPVFNRFSSWLAVTYKKLSNIFASNKLEGVELSDEVRGVLSRLFASEEAINNAQEQMSYGPLTVEQLGISPTEAPIYQKMLDDADDEDRRAMTAMVMKEMQRENTKQWKKGVEENIETITEEMDGMDVYKLRKHLSSGDQKLDYQHIKEMYGSSVAKRLRGERLAQKGGVHPEMLAPAFNFSSGDKMVRELIGSLGATARKKYIKAHAEEQLRQEKGDLRTDGTIAEEAENVVHNDKRADLFISQLRFLNKRAGKAQTPRQYFKAAAEQTVSETELRKLRPDAHKRNEIKAREAALRAAAEGNFKKAALEQHKALRQFYLYRESTKAKEKADKNVSYVRSFKGNKLARLRKSGDHYYGQLTSIMSQFEFRTVSNKKIESRQSMADWIVKTLSEGGEGSPVRSHEILSEDSKEIADQEDREDVQGGMANISDAMLKESQIINYRTLTPVELQGVVDAIKMIDHMSLLKNRLLTQKDKRELGEWVSSFISSIDKSAIKYKKNDGGPKKRRIGSAKSKAEERGKSVREFMDISRTPTALIKMLDGYENDGVGWNLIGAPLQAAAALETEQINDANKQLHEIFKRYSGKELSSFNTIIYDEQTGIESTHNDILSILLNWGNSGNKQRVVDGLKITEAEAKHLMDTYLTEKDTLFAKDIWAYLETYKKPAFDLHKDLYGFTPDAVEAEPFETKFGPMPGGYFPIKYDTAKSSIAEQQSLTSLEEPLTRSIGSKQKLGSTQARAARVVRPLQTDLTNVIFGHVADVIHKTTHGRALYDAGRVLANNGVKQAITDSYGEHVYKQLTSMIRNIKDGSEPVKDIQDQIALVVRNNATLAMLGMSLRTTVLQPFGITNSIVKARLAGIGGMDLANGYAKYMASPAQSSRAIREESLYMKNREVVQSVAIGRIKNKIKNNGWADNAKEAGMIPIMKAQFYTVDAPLYMAARDHFIDKGLDKSKAIELAEQVVRDAQGGGNIIDTAEAMQGGPYRKLFTNFLTYMITTYNLQAENYQQTKAGEQNIFDFAVNTFVLLTMPAVLTAILNDFIAGDEDDEDFISRVAKEQLAFLAGMNPISAQFSGAFMGFDYAGPQGTALIGKTIDFGFQANQGEADEALFRSGLWFVGLLTGLPAAQANRIIFGLKRSIEDDEDLPTTIKQTMFGPEWQKNRRN